MVEQVALSGVFSRENVQMRENDGSFSSHYGQRMTDTTDAIGSGGFFAEAFILINTRCLT